jgi:hypothetical protein
MLQGYKLKILSLRWAHYYVNCVVLICSLLRISENTANKIHASYGEIKLVYSIIRALFYTGIQLNLDVYFFLPFYFRTKSSLLVKLDR